MHNLIKFSVFAAILGFINGFGVFIYMLLNYSKPWISLDLTNAVANSALILSLTAFIALFIGVLAGGDN